MPNVLLCRNGEREAIRCFFPGLYNPATRRSVTLTAEEMAEFYENGVRPAAQQVSPETTGEWPPTYKVELFRASRDTGGHALGSKALPGWAAGVFGDHLKEMLMESGVQWTDGMLFQTQVRGLKGAYFHACDRTSATNALERFSRNYTITEEGQWWVDVGMQFSIEGRVLQWRADCHTLIVQRTFGCTEADATILTEFGSAHYKRDLASHVADLAGCRLEPGKYVTDPEVNPHGITYLQAYTTDKALTYHVGKHVHSKHLTPKSAIRGNPPDFCSSLYQAYWAAQDRNDCAARVEVRVPLENATSVLLSFRPRLLQRCLVNLNRQRWWYVQIVSIQEVRS